MGKTKRDQTFLRRLVFDAGKLILKYQNRKEGVKKEEKESYVRHDVVTQADFDSQNFVMNRILKFFPNDAIIAEEIIDNEELAEKIKANVRSPNKWTLDPVDGTVNFASGEGRFASEKYSVSLAYSHEEMTLVGAIRFPKLKETFYATKKGGSYLNRIKLQVKPANELERCVVAACVPFHNKKVIEVNHQISKKCRAFQAYHCATYSLSLLLKGQIQGYVHPCLKPWDVAAGILILEEAGGLATNENGEDWQEGDYFIASCGGEIHEQLCELVNNNHDN